MPCSRTRLGSATALALSAVLLATVVFGSTGTNDDFCAAILSDWGVTT